MKGSRFGVGMVLGFLLGLVGALGVAHLPSAQAKKASKIDIIYKVVSQNYYLTQKAIVLGQLNAGLNEAIAARTKVKSEQIGPLKNKIQQEIFGLDLKLKQLNQ